MLTRADEYPIHQTPEPIAFSGTDRNFYDRYFFCGYLPDGSGYFAVAFGVYPHLNVADAHFSTLRDGVQHCVHASRLLNMERMELSVGPIRISVIEPLQALRLEVAQTQGVSADLICEGRAFPMQEPRFTRRIGPRMLMDVTRFTQNVRWRGGVSVDGNTIAYDGALGTRDRSWGVRPIGAPDAQPPVPLAPPQFYWLWAPTNFPNLSLFFHVNEDERGEAWNSRAALALDGAGQGQLQHLHSPRAKPHWIKGKRHASALQLDVKDDAGRDHRVTWTVRDMFQMKGIGYGHPEWGHGGWKGELVVEREDFRPDAQDPLTPSNLHVQAIASARHEGAGLASDGVGIVEQLAIGPHAPSGFASILDGAP
jgi:hypothetical protein